MATIKTGQSFSFEFTERSPERNNMMCFLWQRHKQIGWFYPLYYGTGPCEDVTPNFWPKNRNLCKREIYPNYAVRALGTNHKFEYFPYAPIGNKWWFIVYLGGKPS